MKGSKDFNLCRHRSKSELSINRGVVRILICVDTDLNLDTSINEGEVRNSMYVDKDKNSNLCRHKPKS